MPLCWEASSKVVDEAVGPLWELETFVDQSKRD